MKIYHFTTIALYRYSTTVDSINRLIIRAILISAKNSLTLINWQDSQTKMFCLRNVYLLSSIGIKLLGSFFSIFFQTQKIHLCEFFMARKFDMFGVKVKDEPKNVSVLIAMPKNRMFETRVWRISTKPSSPENWQTNKNFIFFHLNGSYAVCEAH